LRVIPGLAHRPALLFAHAAQVVIQDFHPLVFFYMAGLVMFPVGSLFGLWLIGYRLFAGPIAGTSAMFAAFLTIMGLQFLLFAMLFDQENGRDLK
jgi:hypothetical protein